MRRFPVFLLLAGFLAACAPTTVTPAPAPETPSALPTHTPSATTPSPAPQVSPALQPYVPQAGDIFLSRSQVYLDSAEIFVLESFPVQVTLQLDGNLPTPCHKFRVSIAEPDPENRINVAVYSVVDPAAICTQVLKPVSASIPLGSFPAGHYTVWVNGEQVGEFDA